MIRQFWGFGNRSNDIVWVCGSLIGVELGRFGMCSKIYNLLMLGKHLCQTFNETFNRFCTCLYTGPD